MALQTRTPTALPENLDERLAVPTFGEAGGPFSQPVKTGPGYSLSDPLPSPDVNYKFQESGRWTRSMLDRTALSTEGWLSTCFLQPPKFNVGAGTLDVTLRPVRLVVDYGPDPGLASDPDGGVVLELYALTGAPETLPALSDSYVDIAEDGTVTVTSVANGDPPPVLAVGFVRFLKLVTDGLELTTVELEPGVAPFPCLGPKTGAVDIQATAIAAVQLDAGTLTAGSIEASGSVTVLDTGSLEVEDGAAADLLGDVVIGTDATNNLAVFATLTTLLRAHAGVDIDANSLTGTAASRAEIGTLALQIGAPMPAADGEVAAGIGGELTWRDNGAGRIAQGSTVGTLVEVEEDQVSETILAATTFLPTTITATGLVRVIVRGEVQRSNVGSVRVALAANNTGPWVDITNDGVTSKNVLAVNDADPTEWTPFYMERTIGVGATATLFRLDLQGAGGTAKIRETHLKVRRQGV